LIQILCGADSYSIHEFLSSFKKGLGDPETLATNTTRLEGDRLLPATLQAAVETYPFFGDKRLVIVEGLLGRFDGKPKGAPAKHGARETDPLPFASVLKSAPPTTVTVLLEGEVKKTNPLLRELIKADIKEFSPLPASRLPDWIKKRASQMGTAITEDAASLLARLVGPNLWTMSSELEKLSLLAEGRGIEARDVEAAVPASREVSIFELVDAVMEGRSAPAQCLLQAMLRDGQSPSYILFMLARQLRILVRAKSMLTEGRGDGFIQGKLGLHDFALRKTLDQAVRFNFPRLKAFYHRLLEADVTIKTTRYEVDLAVSILVAEGCAG
jgi:DNA polymerase-3 subunit delta